ncbi:hypothetical protein QJS10_CPB17g01104 [Acorus calamus]|uniref:Bromo domain-containing protein n=1 Tax=Acorus calamus TaxID=4465 RepID=A0AAV9CTA5_ACOCL|nr:hypothetical protein QJS10_CPB17g01104 [Acorus calamus]
MVPSRQTHLMGAKPKLIPNNKIEAIKRTHGNQKINKNYKPRDVSKRERMGSNWERVEELLKVRVKTGRYHAWYSRNGECSGNEDDNGISFPLCYDNLVERYPHVEKDHLVKLLKSLILSCAPPLHGMFGGNAPNAGDVPTLLGSGSFSLIGFDRDREEKKAIQLPRYLHWPHIHADQVRGLSLREIGGGFMKHHRAPSVRAACYAIAKPSTMVQKMQNIKRLRGHQNAVYCELPKSINIVAELLFAIINLIMGDITDLAVSVNNALVASASNDFIIRIWRLPDGLPISVLRGHTGAVTAIAFSPRPSALYQLLSGQGCAYARTELRRWREQRRDEDDDNVKKATVMGAKMAAQRRRSSDDGTCRIWDARQSQSAPRIYIPKPPDVMVVENLSPGIVTLVTGKSDPSKIAGPMVHQILCCAYNANGTVFVTGSSDTFARVWNACKTNVEESEQPYHEMDLLSGHENDVNYVQFSGCAVTSRPSPADCLNEDSIPKFKNSWFSHDNIVTCSRDGSAIIWVPRLRKSHGKIGRWTRAYHLKIPPPPIPPQPPRGGPRQRYQPTPRGVNMIVWSLDNRFVLAAIMDEVGQIFIIGTGQGESQKDAKYDQFFLGDYRPLIQDTHGNVLDQETQLTPYRRNMQDFLCDSSMIPYPEPYQSLYQQRRLGALGIEWRPPSTQFVVGPAHNINHDVQDVQLLPFLDLERVVQPLPEFIDAIDWEPENEVHSNDSDSEYNVTDEFSSECEHESLCNSSSGDPECSAEGSKANHGKREGLRRSKRKKRKSEVEFTTSSGRRVKRRNLDEHDTNLSRNVRKKRKKGRAGLRKKSSKSASLRPQRRAARNAITFFSLINGASSDIDDEYESETDSSEDDSMQADLNTTDESDRSIEDTQQKCTREVEPSLDECDSFAEPPEINEPQLNPGVRRLVLKLPACLSKEAIPPEILKSGYHEQADVVNVPTKACVENVDLTCLNTQEASICSVDMIGPSVAQYGCETGSRGGGHAEKYVEHPDFRIRWGEVKARSLKHLRLEDASVMDARVNSGEHNDVEIKANGHSKSEDDYERISSHFEKRSLEENPDHDSYKNEMQYMDTAEEDPDGARNKELNLEYMHKTLPSVKIYPNDFQKEAASVSYNDFCERDGMPVNNKIAPEKHQEIDKNVQPIYKKLRIKSRGLAFGSPSNKLKSFGATDDWRSSGCNPTPNSSMQIGRNLDEGEGSEPSLEHHDGNTSEKLVVQTEDLKIVHSDSTNKMYNVVYRRSKLSRGRTNFENSIHPMEESTSNSNSQNEWPNSDVPEVVHDEVHRTRSVSTRMASSQWKPATSNSRLKEGDGSAEASRVAGKPLNVHRQLQTDELTSCMVQQKRRGNHDLSDIDCGNRRRGQPSTKKLSWLMLLEHEEWYRYIPQLGDEVAYLKQGHQEYLELCHSQEIGPWRMFIGNLRAVEFCRVESLDYSQVPGSGESCCKLTLEFTDPSSSVFGKIFKMTLPELRDFPDFLVERTRYDAAMERNWTHRDKCQVWWRDDEGDGGSWYDGRVVQVKPISTELPDSPWLRCAVQYKNDGSEHHTHCPWELCDPDGQWEHPCIDSESRQNLLSSLSKIEQNASKHDYYGIQKLKQVAQKVDYINRFPVPLSLEVIERRLENNYYRTLDAVKHDVRVMLANAESYFGRNAEYAMKIRRLGDWLSRRLTL